MPVNIFAFRGHNNGWRKVTLCFGSVGLNGNNLLPLAPTVTTEVPVAAVAGSVSTTNANCVMFRFYQ